MHIPDGYLSPQTCAVMYAASLPFWYVASKRVKKALTGRMVPLIAVFAAFSFVIMMFNVPLPGGTTGHAVGGTLMAIVLGPWATVIGVSIALAVQALFFGDGGILAFGANCFNMAIVLPFVGYAIYRLLSADSPITSSRRVIAAGVAGFVGINVAAFGAAVEFGIQPALFHAADGSPLYGPYGLATAIPAMMVGHILVAGPVEAIATALVVAYLQKANLPVLQLNLAAQPAEAPGRLATGPLWIGLAVLALLSPLGLLAAGTAWGEWGAEELQQLLGSVPQGLDRLGGIWSAPLPDYSLPFLENATIGYIVSAIVGIAVLAGVIVIGGWLFVKKNGVTSEH
jgi:cobalt/nickel transport system permease protein